MIRYRPTNEWLEAVEARHLVNDREFAEHAGLTVEQYRTQALDYVCVLVKEVDVCVRIRSERLALMLADATWRTLFHGVESGGLNDIAARKAVEAAVMGIPEDCPPDDRPAYGYIEGSDERTVTTYGDVVLRLNEDVRDRVTFCLADSLNASSHGEYPVIAAAPLLAPELIARHGETDVLAASCLREACDPRDGIAEAQVHGRVRLDEIDRAVFTTRDPDSDLVRALLANDIRFVPADDL